MARIKSALLPSSSIVIVVAYASHPGSPSIEKRRHSQRILEMASDEEVRCQILSIFIRRQVVAGGLLRRNHFIDVRDAIFNRIE